MISYFDQKFTKLEKDIWETRKALERSLNELKTARDTEQQLRLRISELEGEVKDGPKKDLTNEFYIVGTSLFRDVRAIMNDVNMLDYLNSECSIINFKPCSEYIINTLKIR